MELQLMTNESEVNKINKILTAGPVLTGTLRNESDVVSPSILVAVENPSAYNYARIPDFGRYYYVRDMTSVRTGLWRLELESDPLMSFASQILACSVIARESTEAGADDYLEGRNWVTNSKASTQIITFPSGLLDTGEFILITAGG